MLAQQICELCGPYVRKHGSEDIIQRIHHIKDSDGEEQEMALMELGTLVLGECGAANLAARPDAARDQPSRNVNGRQEAEVWL